MRAPTPPDPRQPCLFHEIVEQRWVSDMPFDAGPIGWDDRATADRCSKAVVAAFLVHVLDAFRRGGSGQ